MEDGRMDLFATGKYLDEIVLDGGIARFKEQLSSLIHGKSTSRW
jgi:hypothetical protein